MAGPYDYSATNIYIDEVYLEHIYNPTSEKTIYGNTAANSDDDTSVGYYEIGINHDYQSLKVKRIVNAVEVKKGGNSISRNIISGRGERDIKYEISCTYTNVDVDIWEYLNELMNIQDNGYLLNLHPYVDELPSVLTGYMYLEVLNYQHWDVDLVSFTFRFREV